MSSHCLNCSQPVTQNYCANCGQKTSTHRYSLVHFIEHDIVHTIWHVDRGILFTLKELFTRPGHSVREFIEGKRVNYFSFVTLILLVVAAGSLLAPYAHLKMADLMPESSKAMMNDFERLTTEHPKITLIVFIPMYAFFTFVWFKKAKLNYSEHLVLNSYKIIPEMILALVMQAVTVFYTNIKVLTFIYLVVIGLIQIIYSVWFYYQFFSAYQYSKKRVAV